VNGLAGREIAANHHFGDQDVLEDVSAVGGTAWVSWLPNH
jgi:hypothetical protein